MSRYMILDEETETHTKYKRKANPFLPENWIVMRGWKMQGDPQCSMSHYPTKEDSKPLHIPDDCDVIVAHNAKFELLYEKRFSPEALHAFFKRGGRIHCTQYAYYLINGQTQKSQMVSLDAIIEEYGGRKKIDGVKALWDAGVKTSEIDPELLEDYLIGTVEEGRNSGDIGNTELVYLGQLKEMEELGMTRAVQLRMDGLCATSEMEFNGIKIDTERATKNLAILNKDFTEVKANLEQYVEGMPEGLTFNWGSGTHVSCLLYGGTIRYKKSAEYEDPESPDGFARLRTVEKWPLFDGEPVDPQYCHYETESGVYTTYDPTRCPKCRGQNHTTGNGTCEHCCDGADANWRQDTYKSGKKNGEPKFKNMKGWGERKTKIQDFFHEMPQITKPNPEWKLTTTDGKGVPIYGTGSDIIDILALRDIPFLKLYGRWNSLNKEIGTYYVRYDEKKREFTGMLTCVVPETKIVHHKLNHTSTKTTRLSSNDPNLQNIPRADKSDLKAIFVSRFTEEYCIKHGLMQVKQGVMGEIDYSQLEVVVQGLLSLDVNLCKDLNNKIDFHCKRVALKNSVSYDFALFHCKDEAAEDHAFWKKERTGCKHFSFQRAYGAGAPAISDSTGLPVEDVKLLITAEELEYPGVEKFNAKVAAEVNATSEPFRDGERGWRVFRKGTWQSPTGTIYSWRSWDAPKFMRDKGVMDTYSPPELKNYPVQGTGGEIVQIVLGYLWRWFVANDNFGGRAFLVNTVHDCVWFDMHPEVVDVVIQGSKKIMEAVPLILKKNFDIDCPVPFPVDADTGPNMLDLHHYQAAA